MADATTVPNAVPAPTNANGNLLDEKAQLLTGDPAAATSRPESFHSAAESSVEFHDPRETPASSARTVGHIIPDTEEQDFPIPTSGPIKTPIPKPTTQAPPQAKLSGEQESKYAQVLAKVSTWTTLPASTAKDAASAPLTDDERMWLSRECLLRYLRATKWNTANALKRLQSTLSWRREYGADTFTFDYISPENETGKQVIVGYDNQARPCLYLNPGKQNTEMSDRQIHHLCFMLDRTIDMMPPGQENACLIISFKGAASGKIPTVGQARAVLNILQGHNPERLGKALINELPWYVKTFFKLISPFIDPVTRDKMNFDPKAREHVPPAQLLKDAYGDLDFEYDHKTYWPALQKLTEGRRERMRERWVKGGKRIGEYEEYLKGGERMSLQQELEAVGGTGQVSGASSQVDGVTEGVQGMSVR
ncbi:Phosphatidylinositol transfer protein (PITP) [Saxophila tyrrhenica]|uniref:Phosphatidylinositol transfer protein (PITP) n=1 Tax=Saxophila tyrrhenica TaxID=1690608 RepID=A0AAV9P809_9PEZI|nr:Phosphatidylinositol transfer protein (PITP) [Saxophila tyrrhenica]